MINWMRRASLDHASSTDQNAFMKNMIGFCLQFAALVALPVLIIFQLNFGFRLLWMPALTVAAIIVFYLGHRLRDRVS